MKGGQAIVEKRLRLVRLAGFEPATCCSGADRPFSILYIYSHTFIALHRFREPAFAQKRNPFSCSYIGPRRSFVMVLLRSTLTNRPPDCEISPSLLPARLRPILTCWRVSYQPRGCKTRRVPTNRFGDASRPGTPANASELAQDARRRDRRGNPHTPLLYRDRKVSRFVT